MMSKSIIRFTTSKSGTDLLWNLIAFAILGVTGILINVIIAIFYEPWVLGVFNQVFMVYIVVSQFSVFGLQYSALKTTSDLMGGNVASPADISKCSVQAYTALAMALAFSAFTSSVIALLIPSIGNWFDSEPLTQGLWLGLLGIALFSVNKVILGVLNGLREMKAFAVLQSLRYLILFFFVLYCALQGVEGVYVCLSLAFAESILFGAGSCYLLKCLKPTFSGFRSWAAHHFDFGVKSVLSGAASELNTRIDIAMIGLFMSDTKVGIYSFAAIFAEGIAQLAVVVRNNVNPLFARYHSQSQLSELLRLIRKTRGWFYITMTGVAVCAILLFPWVITIGSSGAAYAEAYGIFSILLIGLAISAGYLPIEMLLVQCGKPLQQTQMRFFVLLSNVAFNLALIPPFGIQGAAFGTALSYVVGALLIHIYAKKLLNLKI